MTVSELRERTVKDLGRLAKKHGIEGWHEMRKEELVKAVSLALRRVARAKAKAKTARSSEPSRNGRHGTTARSNGRPSKAATT